jgi:hypothetical protein
MYIADCDFKLTHETGLILSAPDADSDFQGELRVSFKPIAYYPAEPDTGADADFDAKITKIELRDIQDASGEAAWHRLDPRDKATAIAFLEAHCSRDMWDAAFAETAEHFGAEHRRAA